MDAWITCDNCDYRWEFIKMSDSKFSGLSIGVTIICSFLHIALQSTEMMSRMFNGITY